jgi:peptide/nickel transport system substrate-binding protein
MFKRTLSFWSLFLVLSMLLTACGDSAATPTTASTPATVTTGSTGAATTAATNITGTGGAATAVATDTTAGGGASTATTGATGQTMGPPATTAVLQRTDIAQAFVRNFNPFASRPLVPTLAGIYEPLMIYNMAKGALVPWLADKDEFSADNKTLTFTLHDGVKWSDGQPFTAKDVAFTFNLIKNKTGLQGPGLPAVGASGYIDSVAAPDDKTVVFTFKVVNTPGLYDIIQQNIVPEHIWKDVADPAKYTNDNPVGTGPFTQVTVFQNQAYQVDKNPNYWQAGKPSFNGIRVTAYASNEAQVVAINDGKVDWSGAFIPNIQQAVLSKDSANSHYWNPTAGATVLLELNTTRKPFDDVNVRKAISMALDRQRIVTVAISGYSHPADVTGLSEGYAAWKAADLSQLGDWTTYNAAKANQMLDAAGYKKGGDGIRTTPDGKRMSFTLLMVNGFSDWISAGQIMVPNLKAIGIDVQQKMMDVSAWLGTHQKGDFDASLWVGYSSPTPYAVYRNVMSKSTLVPVGATASANYARYVSTKADDLLTQFASTSDLGKQKEIGQQLQQVFADEAPAIPMWPAPVYEFYSTRHFTGFPDKDNPYALGLPNGATNPEWLIVLTSIKPK